MIIVELSEQEVIDIVSQLAEKCRLFQQFGDLLTNLPGYQGGMSAADLTLLRLVARIDPTTISDDLTARQIKQFALAVNKESDDDQDEG